MPKNIRFVSNDRFVNVAADGPRQFSCIPKVSRFGHITTLPGACSFTPYRDLEFCFRLEGGKENAVDEVDGQRYVTQYPHLFLKRPGSSISYRMSQPRKAVFVIYPAALSDAFSSAGIPFETLHIPFAYTQEIRKLTEKLLSYEDRIHLQGIPDKVDLAAWELITLVFAQHWKLEEEDPELKKIREIASYLECHPASHANFEELALQKGLSRRNFFRCWKKVYQQTPAQFQISKRMLLAERLLLENSMSEKEISSLLGFSSCSYFIQAFRRHAGITPAHFRKK